MLRHVVKTWLACWSDLSSHLGNSIGGRSLLSDFSNWCITIDSVLGAVLDNVALCATPVASFASC